MTAQRGLQRGEQIHALLAQRRQVAADATNVLKALCKGLERVREKGTRSP